MLSQKRKVARLNVKMEMVLLEMLVIKQQQVVKLAMSDMSQGQ